MASPLKPSNVWGPPHLLPRYLQLELSRHVLCNISRFHLRAHTLRAETGCWQNHNRHCDKCDWHPVQDEKCPFLCFLGSKEVNAEDVKLFLLKQTNKSLLFLSETMGVFFVWLAVPNKPSSQPIWLKV